MALIQKLKSRTLHPELSLQLVHKARTVHKAAVLAAGNIATTSNVSVLKGKTYSQFKTNNTKVKLSNICNK